MALVKRKKGKINTDTLITSSKKLRGKGVKAGFPAEGSGRDTYPNGTSLPLVAIWNELGTKTSPPRSFLFPGSIKFVKENKKLIANMQRAILLNTKKVNLALEVVGQKVKTRIQKEIRDKSTPPNSPLTIAIKGSSSPLQDTNLMLNSVDYEVYDRG